MAGTLSIGFEKKLQCRVFVLFAGKFIEIFAKIDCGKSCSRLAIRCKMMYNMIVIQIFSRGIGGCPRGAEKEFFPAS